MMETWARKGSSKRMKLLQKIKFISENNTELFKHTQLVADIKQKRAIEHTNMSKYNENYVFRNAKEA
jgi:hypothetical protein